MPCGCGRENELLLLPAVQAIVDECDACADAILDVEDRTAMRRFLAKAARNEAGLPTSP